MEKQSQSQQINVDYIGTIVIKNELVQFKRFQIKHGFIDILDELEFMNANESTTIFEMQEHFSHSIPTSESGYDYCFPYSYSSAFISSANYPKIYTSEEYQTEIERIKDDTRQKLENQYREKLKNKEISLAHFYELQRNIPNEEMSMVSKFKKDCKQSFFMEAKRFIQAQNYQNSLSKLKAEELNLIMYSTENIGWTTYNYSVNQDIEFLVKTNFGYGYSSYFFVNLKYKGIDLLPFSESVIYYYTCMTDFVRYTRLYDVTRNSWDIAFSFVEENSNLAIYNEGEFIRKWIINECEVMLQGLRKINSQPADVMRQMIEKASKERQQKPVSICVRNISVREEQIYKVYKNEVELALRIEKISGALLFLEKLIALTQISNKVFDYIEEIKQMNKNLIPDIDANIAKLCQEILQNEMQIKKCKERVEHIEIKYPNVFSKINQHFLSIRHFSDVNYLPMSVVESICPEMKSNKMFEGDYKIYGNIRMIWKPSKKT